MPAEVVRSESPIEVFPPRPSDLGRIHRSYEELGIGGKIRFHPGFLGREPLTIRGVAGRLLLAAAAFPHLQALIARAPGVPYLIVRVAMSGTDLAGFAFVTVRKRPAGHTGTFGIFVVPPFEGRGIGRLLTDVVLDVATVHGLVEVELTVQVQNERARGLYERCGFSVRESLPGSDRFAGKAYDSLRMAKRLPGAGVTR